MKNLFPLLLLVIAIGTSCHSTHNLTTNTSTKGNYAAATSGANMQLTYISNYKDAAMGEMERSGIPASIILGQGILESNSGQSDLAQQANNHFGIKCSGGWSGKTFYKKDDDYQNGTLSPSCFRKYNSVAESYYDHAEFLRDPRKSNRYGFLFNLDRTDYRGWANGLQSSGYATSGTYASDLINLIERLRLYEFDRPGSSQNVVNGTPVTYPTTATGPGASPGSYPSPNPANSPAQPAPYTSRIGVVNDVKVVLSRPGQNLEDIAHTYNISPDKVADYNDRGYSPGVMLQPNTRIYIQNKKDKWRGFNAEHFVRDGQTMFDIAQQYGIKLDKLRERNGLTPGQEPATGEKILLRGSLKKGATIRLRDIPADVPATTASPAVTTPAQPAAPDPKKMTTGDDLGFTIGKDDPKPTKPATPATTPPAQPATTGTPYPPADPTPSNPQTQPTWPSTTPTTTQYPPATPVTQAQVPPGYHLVVKGDTLYSIARKYATTVAKIKQNNNLPDDNIKIGQTLKVN
jgi:LysM repeat protein